MVHFCIFGGQDGELTDGAGLYVTLFGGLEMRRPTLVRQILKRRQGQRPGGTKFFLTVFGAAEVKLPTLAEEFVDLREALRTGAISLDEYDRGAAELSANNSLHIYSFTLFGGFSGAELPSEEEELDRLALHGQLGNLAPREAEMLALAAGEKGVQRPTVIRHALATGGV